MKRSQVLEKYRGKSADDFKTFKEKITCARINYYKTGSRKKILTLSRASRKIGISMVYLSQLENGQRSTPNAAIVHKIEEVYGFGSGELAGVLAHESNLIKRR